MEEKMQRAWKSILNLNYLPKTDDSFFELGGNSYLVIKVIVEMKDKYGILLDINDFYTYKTISGILKYYKNKGEK
ncbi:acyl carrier protein [Anaerococcus vaginalis]|uniref:acyl carrier protein n=1 Tax=Anaerococcus vaginalis TaxID=33037 RepID=UPI00242EAB21|nr:acyl carrier protein [Anaerococcus vaginalis]